METLGTSPESAAEFRMIDIGPKIETQRRAVASGTFFASAETILRIRDRSLPKGDVLVLAEVAGIQGAKNTANMLPLCHPLALTSVRVWTEVGHTSVRVFCEAKTVGKTGVEMEALCGVNAALLCIYDLTKGVDPILELGEVRLDLKEGGKSGLWKNPNSSAIPVRATRSRSSVETPFLLNISAASITLSDRCAKNEREDLSGPAISHWFQKHGAKVIKSVVIPDDRKELRKYLLDLFNHEPPQVIVTTGGTGLSKRDISPETILEVCQELGGRVVPGIGELLRSDGAKYTSRSWLSRSVAVLIRDSLIICLPGSPSAVTQGLTAIGELICHAIHTNAGAGHASSESIIP